MLLATLVEGRNLPPIIPVVGGEEKEATKVVGEKEGEGNDEEE